jgi:hypothetical protein
VHGRIARPAAALATLPASIKNYLDDILGAHQLTNIRASRASGLQPRLLQQLPKPWIVAQWVEQWMHF